MPSSPTEEPLSATEWTIAHWRFLHEIVNNWKPEYRQEDQTPRRNSTRVISRMLGKTVRSGPDHMKLEQWHLEAVDEFRECVPGWTEKAVAINVFAILVGEIKRAEIKAEQERLAQLVA